MVVESSVTQIPIMVGASCPGQTTPSLQLTHWVWGRALEMEVIDRVSESLVQGGRVQPIIGIQTLSYAPVARVRATWPGNALPQYQL